MKDEKTRARVVAVAMGLQGVSILGTWVGFILGGSFKDGIRTIENNMYLGLHLVAETVMGTLLIVGSVGLLFERTWGRVVGLVGLGSVIYSTINSMADTLRNKPKLTPILLFNLVLAAATAIMLARTKQAGGTD
jgi:hypothetical protein